MSKDEDMSLTCRQCGREFRFTKGEQEFYELKGFTFPSRCHECRSTKQNQPHHLVCSQCETELEKGASIYCTACLASVHLEVELKAKKRERAASAAHTKLQVTESQKAELEELLRHREQVVAELELKVNSLSQDLDKMQQFQAALRQPPLLLLRLALLQEARGEQLLQS